MYGLTRATLTLIGVALAGVLLWLAAQLLPSDSFVSAGEYWSAIGLVAAAGLVMALSQLLGGWTKWGWPRVSGKVFLLAFLPTLIVGGWILAALEPGDHWLGSHVRSWIGLEGLANDFELTFSAIAFGIGLVFGLTFDTTGPRVRERAAAPPGPAAAEQMEDDRRVRIDGDGDGRPQEEPRSEPAPRSGEPVKK